MEELANSIMEAAGKLALKEMKEYIKELNDRGELNINDLDDYYKRFDSLMFEKAKFLVDFFKSF